MRKVINILVITTIILCLITNNVKASTVNCFNPITEWIYNVGLKYNNEEMQEYKELVNVETPVYKLNNYKDDLDKTTQRSELKNELIQLILAKGYPNKTYKDLHCSKNIEAYIATQEAIYIVQGIKNISLYTAINDEGKRIVNAINEIMDIVNNKIVSIIPMSDKWSYYDNEHNYKEYQIQSSYNISNIYIYLKNNKDIKILDINGNNNSIYQVCQRFKIIVPKELEKTVNVYLRYNFIGLKPYLCENEKDLSKKYVIQEKGIDVIEEEEQIEIKKNKIENTNQIESNTKVEITNTIELTQNPAVGNEYSLLDEQYNIVKEKLITDEQGKIVINLDNGIYYLKQIKSIGEYEINKSLVQIKINGQTDIKINIQTHNIEKIENTTTSQETNVSESHTNIVENNVKEVTNLNVENVTRETINQTNETNLLQRNYFENIINRKNIYTMFKTDKYQNEINEEYKKSKKLEGTNTILDMTRDDYINYIDLIRLNSMKVPNLPVASRI